MCSLNFFATGFSISSISLFSILENAFSISLTPPTSLENPSGEIEAA